MAVNVVHELEVVDVEHEERDAVVAARRADELRAQALVEIAVVVDARQRVGLRLVLELRAGLRVVERERRRVADPPRELEVVVAEARAVADPVQVQRPLDGSARDQRERDQRLRLDRRPGTGLRPRVELSGVRPDGPAVQNRPPGDPLAVDGRLRRISSS